MVFFKAESILNGVNLVNEDIFISMTPFISMYLKELKEKSMVQ